MILRDLMRTIVPDPKLTVKLRNIYEDEIGSLQVKDSPTFHWEISDDAYPMAKFDSVICELSFSDNLLEIMVHNNEGWRFA